MTVKVKGLRGDEMRWDINYVTINSLVWSVKQLIVESEIILYSTEKNKWEDVYTVWGSSRDITILKWESYDVKVCK